MTIRVKTIARQAAEDALAASLRQTIAERLTEELTRALSEPPFREELGRVVREAVADVVRSIEWGNGRAGFARK